MNSDETIHNNVLDELEFDPEINTAAIGVTVHDGVVTLTGHVPTYAQKFAAERAAKRVKGVRALAQELEVRLDGAVRVDDEEIARRVANIMSWSVLQPKNDVKVRVQDGWVTLHGEVQWAYQREDAERAIRRLEGVKGVSNAITLSSQVKAQDVSAAIHRALTRNAEVDANAIHVAVDGGKVTLTGKVHAWNERSAAEYAAWASPGVSQVFDYISIS